MIVTSRMSERRLKPIQYSHTPVQSSAQNQEDVLIDRAFFGKKGGFYVDIGAGDPIADSVTRWFYGRGWRGVNIEPNPTIFQSIAKFRPDDVNLNVGISDAVGELTYHQVIQNAVGHGWGLSGFDPAIPDRARSQGFSVESKIVPVIRLQDVAERIDFRDVDFLKVDVEGLEPQVLGSVDWTRFRPKLVCVEAVAPLSARPTFSEWEHLLPKYILGVFDGVNNYYVREDCHEILTQLNASVNCNDRWTRFVYTP